ncbi:MAG: hypothetical protein GY953_51960, partial [bacterium]|nr:hypothetical protein [bacterium]
MLANRNVHGAISQTAFHAGLDPERNLKLISSNSQYPAYVRRIVRHISGDIYECELESSRHSIWAQDGYCCLQSDDGRTVLLEPLAFNRGGDHFVAEQVAAETNMEAEVTKYYIEGGNILAGDNYLLVGKDYLEYNQQQTGESEAELTQSFRDLFGVEHVIWLGLDQAVQFPIYVYEGRYQPIFHIDMYITL